MRALQRLQIGRGKLIGGVQQSAVNIDGQQAGFHFVKILARVRTPLRLAQ